MTATRIVAIGLLSASLSGCSGGPSSKPTAADPRPEVIEPVYRAATELRAAQDIGMNRQRFGDLLQKFATEITVARDKAESPREQQVIQIYSDVLRIYKDSAAVWDVKLSIPDLKNLADQTARMRASVSDSNDAILQSSAFKMAVIEGIPLNTYPEGSTGIDDVVGRYELPVTNSEGWKTIPDNSLQAIWAEASRMTDEALRMYRGSPHSASASAKAGKARPRRGQAKAATPQARAVSDAISKSEHPSALVLYQQAEEMKDLTPEKSLSLLEQAKRLQHDAALGDKVNRLSQELHRPDVLYRQAVSYKKSNPDRAKSLLEEALNLQAMDLEPNNDIKQNLRQQILKLLAELEHQRRPGAASVPF